MNKTRTITTKLTMVAFLFAMVLLLMPTNTFAAKKPGQVKNIEEVKATDNSITIKFKKVKGAKSYQIQVYYGGSTKKTTSTVTQYGDKKYKYKYIYRTGKLAKKTTTKKTTCTIKGIGFKNTEKLYAVKVRAFDGKNYGKWGVLYVRNTRNGVHTPGKSAATGNNLKKQYEDWKKTILDNAKAKNNSIEVIDSCFFPTRLFKCTENTHNYIEDPGQYSMEEVYQTYKRGYGTDLEIYHLIMDICKDAGLRCDLKKAVSWKGNYMIYALVSYCPDKAGEGRRLHITPRHVLSSSWDDEFDTIDYLGIDK